MVGISLQQTHPWLPFCFVVERGEELFSYGSHGTKGYWQRMLWGR
jgi:hypothetical protein